MSQTAAKREQSKHVFRSNEQTKFHEMRSISPCSRTERQPSRCRLLSLRITRSHCGEYLFSSRHFSLCAAQTLGFTWPYLRFGPLKQMSVCRDDVMPARRHNQICPEFIE